MLNKALSGLDPEYVQQYKGIITGEIEKEIVRVDRHGGEVRGGRQRRGGGGG